ncbi:MAG: DNA-binding protein, partial [Deltaproteobacteria bacterium]|nr:DNA-binding protein [Deltaproteobacteria bacterium]
MAACMHGEGEKDQKIEELRRRLAAARQQLAELEQQLATARQQ